VEGIFQIVEVGGTPSLLPIFRSRQQATILALVLGDPDIELSLTEIAERTGAPLSSVHREIRRAESAGLVLSRKVGNVRMVRANVDSPYYAGLADALTRAFGVPAVLAEEMGSIDGIDEAYLFGSWAARFAGEPGSRPVGDIDLLVLGRPDRTALYEAAHRAERRLGREVQVTIRHAGWLEHGDGSFHDTVKSRPMLRLAL
jgi:predicted nucleotidyltransferase/DNA-binding transcriptional ArsR family regulator